MQIYADPSRVPVVLIEQHVMVVPQHGSSKVLATNSSEQKDMIVLPKLQGDSLALKSSAGKKGRILRAVIFVHGFQASTLYFIKASLESQCSSGETYYGVQKAGTPSGFTSCTKSMASVGSWS